jgi:hypothetical protein
MSEGEGAGRSRSAVFPLGRARAPGAVTDETSSPLGHAPLAMSDDDVCSLPRQRAAGGLI